MTLDTLEEDSSEDLSLTVRYGRNSTPTATGVSGGVRIPKVAV